MHEINASTLYPNSANRTKKCIISLAHSFENKLIFQHFSRNSSCFENKIVFFLSDTSAF